MCGIHGMTWRKEADLRVQRMIKACEHRGPDGHGLAMAARTRVVFGHNLLAIRDTDIGRSLQPWTAQPSGAMLTFNGEIYDFGPLAKRSDSGLDTHELGMQLDRYGPKALEQLDGMYALAWHKPEDETILLARDKLGAKPLYYILNDDGLIFSSEYRGLFAAGVARKLDPIGLRLYLQFGYVPGPRTLIKDVFKLVPGERRVIGLDRTIRQRWSGHTPIEPTEFDPKVYREKLVETVAKTAVSCRPTGLYLSGGLDSASVLWALHEAGIKIETLSMRFAVAGTKQALLDGDCDAAALVAQQCGSKHAEILFSETDYIRYMDEAFSCDEPISRKGMPAYLAAHIEAKRRGWVVAFTGDGGDEILSGYGRHIRLIDPNYIKHQFTDPFTSWIHLQSQGGAENAWRTPEASKFSVEEYMRAWVPPVLSGDRLRDELLLENMTHLAEDFLLRSDKLGMSQGLECRFPLLHEPFRSYALGLPSREKLTGWTLKWCTRQAMRGYLPDAIIDKPKSGWGPPTGQWLAGKDTLVGPLGERIKSTIVPGRVPAIDELLDVTKALGRIKVRLALFYLYLWAEQIGL